MNLPRGFLLHNGKYRLTNVIGQGGFGITYKGVLRTEVRGDLGAIKTQIPICVKEYFFKDYCYRDNDTYAVKIHSETGKTFFDKFKEKLIKEAKILSEVHHPHIVNVLEVFEENNTAYIVMQYIEGKSLKELVEEKGILPEEQALKYIHQIGEALQFVHNKQILHLDVKPSNILINKADNAFLIDFGVSKRFGIEQEETSTTLLTLSKGFASVEQYDDEGIQNFTPHPDIYSLGATLYYLLTAKIPTESILRATRPLIKPREFNPAINEQTEAAILKSMEVVPANRYASIADMMEALGIPIDPQTQQVIDNATNDSDETQVISIHHPKGKEKDNEQTLVNTHQSQPEEKKKKKRSKPVLYTFLVILLLGGAYALYHGVTAAGNNRRAQTGVATPDSTETETGLIAGTTAQPVTTPSSTTPQTTTPGTSNQQNTHEQTTPADNPGSNEQPADTTTEGENDSSSEATGNESIVTADAYNALLASAKEKINRGGLDDLNHAEKELQQAKNINNSEEINNLLKQIVDKRLSHYEILMPFSNESTLTIVKKLSNNLYGAINKEGIEVIDCKYVFQSLGDNLNNRNFEREDGSYDIYDSEGKSKGTGVMF